MIDKLFFHPRLVVKLIRNCNISKLRLILTTLPYYISTLIFSLIDGISMVLLVGCFTNGFTLADQKYLPEPIISSLQFFIDDNEASSLIFFLIILFCLSLILRIGISFSDGFINSWLRERIQRGVFQKYLKGDWSKLRSFRVGDAVGTTTLESMTCAKYLTSSLITFYYLLSACMMAVLAVFTSFNATIYLGVLVLPLLIFIVYIFRILARISKKHALLRNLSSANITDRYNGLLQIHIDDNTDYHLEQGMLQMPELKKFEVLTAFYQAIIGSFNILIAVIVLFGFTIWSWVYGFDSLPEIGLIASVGVLGLKFLGHLNSLISMIGNLTRLSGSVNPVLSSFDIPFSPDRILIKNKVNCVELTKVSYSYGDHHVVKNISFKVECGAPVLLNGRSGGGKTTIANIIAGLYFPSSGIVNYTDSEGNKFSSEKNYSKVGFVTQDVYLFQGSLKQNLTAGRNISDDIIWSILRQVDAEDFVIKMGGLKAESIEAGRSLSGGQRRRLGIARVLLMGADILIFDEITAGLDVKNKENVINIISRLSQEYIVLLIAHEDLNLPRLKTIKI